MNPARAINEAARGVSSLPQGTHFAQAAIALAIAQGEALSAVPLAEARWGASSTVVQALKQAVDAGGVGSENWSALADYRFMARDFVTALRPATVLGKLTGVRHVPPHVRLPKQTSGTSAGWVGEGSPRPLSGLTFESVTIPALTLSAIVCSSKELMRVATPAAESLVRADLISACARIADVSFLDPTLAGEDGVSPPSITYGAMAVTPSGTTEAALREDLASLFDAIDGDLEAPVLIMDRRQAIRLALMDSPFTQNVKAGGGTLAGVPLVVSSSSPVASTGSPPEYTSQITLLDAADLLLADEGLAEIDYSQQTALQMDSAPDSPPTGSTVLVSLYQHGLAAWRVNREINWQMGHPDRVAYISGASYAG